MTRAKPKRPPRPYFKELDAAIGLRVRAARIQAGMPQTALGRKLGITFQQVQKYEKGLNRISLSTMIHIAKAVHKPLKYFVPPVSKTGQPLIEDLDKGDFILATRISELHQPDRAIVERLVRQLVDQPSPENLAMAPPPEESKP